jgi:hypothetical protein
MLAAGELACSFGGTRVIFGLNLTLKKMFFQIRRNGRDIDFFSKFCPNGKAGNALTQAPAEANGAISWP